MRASALPALIITAVIVFALPLRTNARDDPAAPGPAAAHVRLVQTLEARELGLAVVDGVTYDPDRQVLLIPGQGLHGQPLLASVSPLGRVHRTIAFPASLSGADALAFDPARGSVLVARGDRLTRTPTVGGLPTGASGVTVRMPVARAAGVSALADGRTFVLDPTGPAVVTGLGDSDAFASIGLNGATKPMRGLAAKPDGRLFTIAADGTVIYEFDAAGTLLTTRDIADTGISEPTEIVLAPSADPTDGATKQNLYVAEGGTDTATGGIYEFELTPTPLAATIEAAAVETATLVHTVEGSALSPESPDPSGIGYNSNLDRLVMTDGEIEEEKNNSYPYPGTNGWLLPRNGASTTATFDTTTHQCRAGGSLVRNVEPVGVAYNSASNTYFVVRDGSETLWELSASFAPLRCLGLESFGVADAEGVAYGNGSIFIADGTGAEVWRISPGPNGVFGTPDGTGAIDDVLVSHFDTASLGQPDAEGIEFDPTTGTLYIVSNKDGSPILEVTTDGVPVRTLQVSGVTLDSARGLTLAPGTTEAVQHIYVADARVDNNRNGGAIDGRIYELATGASAPTAPDTTITGGPSGTVTSSDASFTFSGSAGTTAFECRLDGAAFSACTSPRAYTGLSAGSHTFEVRALAGSTPDPTPAARTWSIGDSEPPPTDGNLLVNPGFELDANANNIPDNWGTKAKFTRSSVITPHGGSFAGRHFATNNSGYTVFQEVPVTAGTTYDFRGWVNVPTTTDAFTLNLRVRWMSGSTTITTTTMGTFTGPTVGWQQFSGSRAAPAGATSARVMMALKSLDASIYVDDFWFGAR